MSEEIVPQVFENKEFGTIRALRDEMAAGRIHATLPHGQDRGQRIRVDEVDRWMEASTR